VSRLRPVVLAAALFLPLVVTACGSGGQTVDNDSCPYDDKSAGPYSPNPPDTSSQPAVGQVIPEMPHEHVAEGTHIQYAHDPPTSGCHYSLGYGHAPIAAGAYTKQIAREYWVHNLEHGYVAVLYNCPAGCDADFQQLRTWLAKQKPDPGLQQFAQANPAFKPYTKVIILPYPQMTPRFAAISWDYYDPMNTLDLNEVQRFYDNHVGHAPESLFSP
jgi:hypothetical protein